MQTAREILNSLTELIEKTIITFSIDEKEALFLLDEVKKQLSEKKSLREEENQFYAPAVYNALAVINSAPQQKMKNRQLLEALTDAKEELKIISEMV